MSTSTAATPKNVESKRGAIWVWPTLAGAAAFGVATGLVRLEVSGSWAELAWPGDSGSASVLAQVVASSVITVTTLTFSLTVLALQLASQQFSPRLLREFTRDPVTRIVLAVLVGAFVLAVTVLRHLRTDTPVPHVAVLAVWTSGLASLVALLAFITHIVRILRVDTMMAAVHDEASAAITAFYPAYGDDRPRDPAQTCRPEGGAYTVTAARSGFCRKVDVVALVAGAQEQDLFLELLTRPGDHIVRTTPMAIAWASAGGPPEDKAGVRSLVNRCVELGHERTVEQDSGFGFRQLEDIAVKALSPGINDPVTAAHAVGHLSDLLVQVLGRRLGGTAHEDDQGTPRAVVPDRDIDYYLDLACGQVRRYAAREPTVLVALLRLLRDAAAASRDKDQREAILTHVRRIVDTADDELLPIDRRSVTDMADRVRQALAGQVLESYIDRSGETRSI